jgi:hypothetical protein
MLKTMQVSPAASDEIEHCTYVRGYTVRISSKLPIFPTEIFHSLTQCRHENSEKVLSDSGSLNVCGNCSLFIDNSHCLRYI